MSDYPETQTEKVLMVEKPTFKKWLKKNQKRNEQIMRQHMVAIAAWETLIMFPDED